MAYGYLALDPDSKEELFHGCRTCGKGTSNVAEYRALIAGIKGCLNYGLKNVAKTFYKYGYIKTIWDSGSSCADGADAAIGAYRVDKETRKKNVSFKSDPLAQEIIKYNEVDCKVMVENPTCAASFLFLINLV